MAAASALASASCATLDTDAARTASAAIPVIETVSTPLGTLATPLATGRAESSAGFHLLRNGIESLGLRLDLAAKAEKTIDAQYYIIAGDKTGVTLMGALLDAADRGVRVRVLVDDIQTSGYDQAMAALDSHPNLEIRVFNPFTSRAHRLFGELRDFRRLNHRMHNKSFTADNQLTIVGGRNIADEYFGAHVRADFSDFDVLGIGPVVNDVSATFDLYWNHRMAIPVHAVTKPLADPPASLAQLRGEIARRNADFGASPYGTVLATTRQDMTARALGALTWAPYRLYADSPDKIDPDFTGGPESIFVPLSRSLELAGKEVLIVSPYFVPLDYGIQRIREVRARNIEVRIFTNSLASENHFVVHGGYAPARKPLLQAGVRLFETRPDAEVTEIQYAHLDPVVFNLHTKAFVVDRRELFIGSFNFDPRSAKLNTEMGLIIDSAELAGTFASYVDDVLTAKSYELFLDSGEHLRWREQHGGPEVVYTHEPRTGAWLRIKAGFARWLPFRQQL